MAIGSEFGQNRFEAGRDVNLTGGNIEGSFAHLGYIQNVQRGNNTGNDFSAAGQRAANGDIVVIAGANVILTGGGDTDGDANTDGLIAFAQIGHGGARLINVNGQTVNSVAEIVGDITVNAGTTGAGDVLLGSATGATQSDYAQIGHGSFLLNRNTDNALAQGNISGNIVVTAGENAGTDYVGSDIKLNAVFVSQNPKDEMDNQHFAQIGHGGHVFYVGGDLTGAEATHGNIQGNITLDAKDQIVLGANASALAAEDRYLIHSQVGHGGYIEMVYDGRAVNLLTGDNSLDAVHGRIASFDALTNGDNYTTNINTTAAEFQLLAQEGTQNSAGATGLVVDNLQRSQIGHGQHTVAARSTSQSGGNYFMGCRRWHRGCHRH